MEEAGSLGIPPFAPPLRGNKITEMIPRRDATHALREHGDSIAAVGTRWRFRDGRPSGARGGVRRHRGVVPAKRRNGIRGRDFKMSFFFARFARGRGAVSILSEFSTRRMNGRGC